jgi:Spy/CpxP family protein refolding chaperone
MMSSSANSRNPEIMTVIQKKKFAWVLAIALLVLVGAICVTPSFSMLAPRPEEVAYNTSDTPIDYLPVEPNERLAALIEKYSQDEKTAKDRSLSKQFDSIFYNVTAMKAMDLTSEQKEKIRQLNALTQDILQGSLRRDLEALRAVTSPTKPLMKQIDQQLAVNAKRRAETVAAAEEMLTTGILSRSQAEKHFIYFWGAIGPDALKDDRLAQRLGLSREQRKEIAKRLDESFNMICEVEGRVFSIPKNAPDQSLAEIDEARKKGKSYVFEALTPEQMTKWETLLNLPKPPVQSGKKDHQHKH